VVAIGASAGGLDALERLFHALPADSGAAFVVVQHLSPDHKSMMDNLLSRYTPMPVRVAAEGMALRADAVFLIPPGKEMRLEAGCLHLSPKPEHGLSLPIDIFFHSLAEQCADRALAVVLSGTGSDGSRGVVAVNAAGGFVFVQEPGSARFDGMPRAAMATGLADVVAPAEALAERIAGHLQSPLKLAAVGPAGLRNAGARDAEAMPPLEGILEVLHGASGIDFREYKPNTVLRRIERRMQVLHCGSHADYLARLRVQPGEQTLLRRELLIPVTRFFRDAEAFEQLGSEVIDALLAADDSREPLRVWVACCATGEEAYTMAMLFAEAATRLNRHRPVKIFATDVEQHYLDHAGAALYADSIAAEVSVERLERFFIRRTNGYVVRPELRQTVIFARHNLVADPPFTRMDLVSCRNALIYMQPAAQERAMHRLQYALKPGGTLMLGASESLGALHRDFQALPGRGKLYRLLRRARGAGTLETGGRHLPTVPLRARGRGEAAGLAGPQRGVLAQAQRALLREHCPPSLLVGPARELLHVYGQARDWISLPEGDPTLDVLRLLPREVATAAALLLQALAAGGASPQSAELELLRDGQLKRVRLLARALAELELPAAAAGSAWGDGGDIGAAAVRPEAAPAAGGPHGGERAPPSAPPSAPPGAQRSAPWAGPPSAVLLSLIELAPPEKAAGPTLSLDAAQQHRIELLERELALTHSRLQSTIEELETANEELQATNEELMASNEELQSTNEELQSVNEELYTVNSEYQEKVEVLNSLNADLENLVRATGIPTMFVDAQLRLVRFTPEVVQLFKLRDGDRGRPADDFAHLLDYPEFFADLRRTLAQGGVHEREAASPGRWWHVRMQADRGPAHGEPRAVVTFFDTTALRDSARLQAVVDSLAEHVAVIDRHGTITMVNAAWRRFAAVNGPSDLAGVGPGANYLAVCARAAAHDAGAARTLQGLQAVLEGSQPSFTQQYPCDTPQRRLRFLMHVAPLQLPAGGAVVSHIDVTAWGEPAQRSDP
jgi:two-component system CheB/CheR fusion protein